MTTPLSNHAASRSQTRGCTSEFIETLVNNADIDMPVGDDCRLMRVSRRTAAMLAGNDRLGRYGVIWSDRFAQVVTILPLHAGRSGRRYRRGG